MFRFTFLLSLVILALGLYSCKKDKTPEPEAKLIFRFKFDPTQERLDNMGQPSTLPAGHAGQSPQFKKMGAHYIELAQNALTPLGQGTVLYIAEETSAGGSNAIDFEKQINVAEDETFFEIPLKDVPAGSWQFLRVSLAYQNYDVQMRIDTTISGFPINGNFTGNLASFVGFNTFIKTVKVGKTDFVVNANKLQGFWAFETDIHGFSRVDSGSAPAGATTVPNPVFATSPIPQGSCVVTGEFEEPFVVGSNEKGDIIITVSLSVNQSFEWKDDNANGLWEPLKGEQVVDMGIRGLKPIVSRP